MGVRRGELGLAPLAAVAQSLAPLGERLGLPLIVPNADARFLTSPLTKGVTSRGVAG